MPRFDTVRDAFADCFRNGRLWLVQFFANPILFGLFAAWLLIPVASSLHLIVNFIVALLLLAAVLVIHAATLNYFFNRPSGENLPSAFRRAVRHLIPVAICIAVFCLLWLFVEKIDSYQILFPTFARSTFPAWLRRHVTLSALESLFTAVLFLVRWVLVPGLVLPFVLQTADSGFRGFGLQSLSAWRQTVLSVSYWVVLLLAALLGVLATEKIMALTPDFRTSTFRSEAVSLAFRLTIAYAAGLFSWILACSMVGRCAAAARVTPNVSGNPAA